MAKISEDCLKQAFDNLKYFSKEELEDYVRDVFSRAKEIDEMQGDAAIERAQNEINEGRLKEFFSATTQTARNIMAFENNAKPIRDGKADLRGVLAGRSLKGSYWKRTEKDSNWRKRNVPDAVKAEYEKAIKFVLGDFTHEEVEHFSKGDNDAEICDIIDGKASDNPVNKKIAQRIRDYWDYAKSQLITSGAMGAEEFHPKRYFRAVHDAQKLINGGNSLIKFATKKIKPDINATRAWWRNTIKSRIDIPETFKKTNAADLEGNIDMSRVDEIVNKSYDDITTNQSQIFTGSRVVNDRRAIQRKKRMFYVFKSMRDQYEYNKVAGRGNLFNMMMRDMQSMTQDVGATKVWGDSPESMYLDLKKVQEEVNHKDDRWWKHTDNYFNSVFKRDRDDSSPNASNFFANLRTLTSMARLPLITVDSISDIGYISSFATRYGDSYFKAWGYHLSHLFDSFPTEERTRIAKLMKAQVDSHLGYMGRWTETNNVSDWLNKISTRFFKLNMLEAFDRGNKVGAMTLMSKSIGNNAKKSWKTLPEPMREMLGRFIDEKEWDLLRTKNNDHLFTTENVDVLTDSELRAHYATTEKNIPLSELRDDLYRRVYSMFTVASENAVLSPSDFERVFMFHGTTPGQTLGVAARMFGQFKMYTIAYIDRVLIDGMRGADTVQQKLMWATAMLMGTLPLSYMGMWLKNHLMGLTMPDPSRMNIAEREKYLMNLLAPSLGLFAGLLDQRNQNGDMWASLLGSPSIRLMFNAMSAPLALLSGNPKHAAKQLANTANYFLPLQTTPIISPILRQAMGDEAHLEPGQEHIFGR